jgi:hypothetical protein
MIQDIGVVPCFACNQIVYNTDLTNYGQKKVHN